MRFTQVLVDAAPDDAVTCAALEIDRIVAPVAETSIRAASVDPAMTSAVVPLDAAQDAPPPSGEDVVLLHASVGRPDLARWLEGRPDRLVILDHGAPPARWFDPLDRDLADDLRLGRNQLSALKERAVLALAVSESSAAELALLGFDDVRVCPPVFDPLALVRTHPDPSTNHHFHEAVTGPVMLFVGQLLPHQRIDWLIEAYFMLITYLVPEAHLIVAGPSPLPAYRETLQTFTDELNLNRLWLTGRPSASALAAYYGRADVVVSASEHDQTGSALLQAMAFAVPVVARRLGAIPETVGDAGILLDPSDRPGVCAEVLAELFADPVVTSTAALRGALVERGKRRIERVEPDGARANLRHHLGEVVPGLCDDHPGTGR